MPIALILIAVVLALLFIPLQERAEKNRFERELKQILKDPKVKPKEPFSIDPEIIGRVLFIAFITLVIIFFFAFVYTILNS